MTPDPRLAVAPPPPCAQRMDSDDPDEVTSWSALRDGRNSRVPHGTGPYGFRAEVLDGDRVAILWGWNELGHTLHGTMRQPPLHMPLTGLQEYRYGRKRITAAPGDLVFVAPDAEITRSCGPSSLFAMDVDPAMLAEEMRSRDPGTELTWMHYPRRLDVMPPLRLALARAAAELIDALDPSAPPRQRLVGESWLVARLADVLLASRPQTSPARLALSRLADLEDWIDAHLGEPITMGRLCEVACASERSLQLAFSARRGMSPMQVVLARRLAAAHRRLSRSDAQDNVTSVANDLGFRHFGRFSIAYRETFGETPSRTLMRKRVR